MNVSSTALRSLWKPGREWRDGPEFPAMIDLPLGVFFMGEHDEDKFANDTERPRHRVTIAHSLAMGRFCVTTAEFATYSGAAFDEREASWPVVNVSWEEAVSYCAWLSCLTGHHYRLPAESEWEYAASGGTTHPFPTGKSITLEDANFYYDETGNRIGLGRRTPVDAYPPNRFGLHDMAGNVCEWVSDLWHATLIAAPEEGESWDAKNTDSASDPARLWRVLRGGAWDYLPRLLRTSWRDFLEQKTRRDNVGFRVVCDILDPT